MGDLIGLAVIAGLLLLGYLAGHAAERRHRRALTRRESAPGPALTNLSRLPVGARVVRTELCVGQVVIATDYFKSFAASLRNIVGGEMATYQTLMRRARREATVRMLERARRAGATEVWNVRYETSNIRSGVGRNRAAISVEVFAFGTAVARR